MMIYTLNSLTYNGTPAQIFAGIVAQADDIELIEARNIAIEIVGIQPQPYTAQEYIEARRWQQQPDTTLALDTGRLSAAEYAAAVVSGYEAAQRTLKMNLSLLAQAKTIDEIEAILGRL